MQKFEHPTKYCKKNNPLNPRNQTKRVQLSAFFFKRPKLVIVEIFFFFGTWNSATEPSFSQRSLRFLCFNENLFFSSRLSRLRLDERSLLFFFFQKKLDRLRLFVYTVCSTFGRRFHCRRTLSRDEMLAPSQQTCEDLGGLRAPRLFVYSVSICEYWQSEQLICAQFSSACRVWLYILNLQEATALFPSLFKKGAFIHLLFFSSPVHWLQSVLLEIKHIVLHKHFDSCRIVQEGNLIGW